MLSRRFAKKYHLEESINNLRNPISPDRGSFEKLMDTIVLYKNADHQHKLEQSFLEKWKIIDKSTNPNSEEIDI